MEEKIEKVEEVELPNDDSTEGTSTSGTQNKKNDRKPRQNKEKRQRQVRQKQPKLYEEEVISIGRVTKVTKGGRHFRFSAVVVVGNKKGKFIRKNFCHSFFWNNFIIIIIVIF